MTDDVTLTHDPAEAIEPVTTDATFDLTEGEESEEDVFRPRLRPGQWYVVHSKSGYEENVKLNMNDRIASMHMKFKIYKRVVPMKDVVGFKGGRK